MNLLQQFANIGNHAAALAGHVKSFLTTHQVFSRMIWLGVGPTAVLVMTEISRSFVEGAG